MRCPWIALLLLAGCPNSVPAASRFAGADQAASLNTGSLDTGRLGSGDLTETASLVSDVSPQDGAGDDLFAPDSPATVADANPNGAGDTSPDAGALHGICPKTGGLGLHAKVIDGGANEFLYALVPTGDGSALLVGETGNGGSETDAWVIKVGALGTAQWTKTYGVKGEEEARAAVALPGGGSLIAGMTRTQGAGNADGWLLALDANGTPLWDNAYGGTSTDLFYGIAPAPGGGVVCAGSNRSLSGSLEKGWLARMDAGGELLWQDKYGGGQIDELFAVVAAADGTFAAAGKNSSQSVSGSDAWLLIVDGKGKTLQSKVYNSGDYDEARALAPTADGGYVLTGVASVKGNPELWLARTDASGALAWKDTLGGNQSDAGRGIAVVANGDIFVAGETDSTPPGGSSTGIDGWLLRWDGWGNRLWQRRYGDGGNQWLSAVAARPDAGAWLAGRVFSQGAALDGWLLRTDPWGHASCQGLGPCAAKDASDCADGLPCTIDLCDSIDGCTHKPLTDAAPCATGKACSAGACVGG